MKFFLMLLMCATCIFYFSLVFLFLKTGFAQARLIGSTYPFYLHWGSFLRNF